MLVSIAVPAKQADCAVSNSLLQLLYTLGRHDQQTHVLIQEYRFLYAPEHIRQAPAHHVTMSVRMQAHAHVSICPFYGRCTCIVRMRMLGLWQMATTSKQVPMLMLESLWTLTDRQTQSHPEQCERLP